MIRDERQELLREACSLGNLKAVKQFVRAGVDVNSSNRMNGWTALHWASHRGQYNVVEYLLQNGADPSLVNTKGETPAQLATHPKVCDLLNAPPPEQPKVRKDQSELDFVPNYLANPDLTELWDVPSQEDLSSPSERPSLPLSTIPSSQKTENLSIKAELGSTYSEKSTVEPYDAPTIIKEEILIYSSSESSSPVILGAIYADPCITLQALEEQIGYELTDVSKPFKIFKMNRSGHAIPLHSGQFKLLWSDVIKPLAGDSIILQSSS